MKLIFLLAILTGTAFGAETTTECPMMREMMKRNNPKANMMSVKVKINNSSKSFTATAQ